MVSRYPWNTLWGLKWDLDEENRPFWCPRLTSFSNPLYVLSSGDRRQSQNANIG